MSELKNLITKRGLVKAKLTRYRNYIEQIEISKDTLQLKDRFCKFEESWAEFDAVQNEIELLNSDSEQIQERSDFENLYFDLASKTRTLIPSKQNVNTQQNPNSLQQPQNIQVQLPKINLPTFDGKYEEWTPFSELFKSLIHDNSSLSEIQKYHYLTTSLRGQAKAVIDTLDMSPENYINAWGLLKQRFYNKRVIVHTHVNSILNQQRIDRESGTGLRHLVDSTRKHLRALETLGEPVDQWGTLLVNLTVKKLDQNTIRLWEQHFASSEVPTFSQLTTFLESRCQTLESLEVTKNQTTAEHPKFKQQRPHSSLATNITKCPVCNGNHHVFHCKDYTKLTPSDRFQKAKHLGLCINCLSKSHAVKDCKSSNCRLCSRKHHSLLHFETHAHQGTTKTMNDSRPNVSVPSTFSTESNHEILLSTALVHIEDKDGKMHECRAFLDSASQSNFMTEYMSRKLKLDKNNINVPITGIGQARSKVSHGVTCTIHSKHNAYKVTLDCLLLPKITNNLPSAYVDSTRWHLPPTIHLADIQYNKPGPIDLLIGAELFFKLMSIGQLKPHKDAPIFQKTSLGWVASGRVPLNESSVKERHCHITQNERVSAQLQKFWELEECVTNDKETVSKNECEDFYAKTTTRDLSGKYTVTLPTNDNLEQLGESYKMAESRLIRTEKTLAKNPTLHQAYVDFLDEYLELGHMELVDTNTDPTVKYYMPHLPVVKEASSTTKLRVVFDASAKSSTGISLNDTLKVGPTIQPDLFSTLCRFRSHKYVLTADIEKMYRQIDIDQQQADLQRILWRAKSTEPIRIYRLKTVTYGTASAPFLAIRTLQQLAIDEEDNFPRASSIVLNDFYVDDLMTGANTKSEALKIQAELTQLMKAGRFNLRKWNSNSNEILNQITEPKEDSKHQNTDSSLVKVLGMHWNAQKDSFQYIIKNPPLYNKICKRSVLSDIAGLFDPLGLLGPVILKSKLFMQELWKLQLKWDESLPVELHSSWQVYRHQLSSLSCLEIHRHVMTAPANRTELHGFCDASERAYGACIYIRSTDDHNETKVTLLCSKSRVAPIKKITLPRLELCGALLLSKLVSKVTQLNNLHYHSCTLWTDSTIVLSWLQSSSSKWKTFVANRVSEIQNNTTSHSWKHVRTSHNPADLVSRGLNPIQMENCNLWWHGPEWLELPSEAWPTQPHTVIVEAPEQRKGQVSLFTAVNPAIIDVSRHSTLLKLQRSTAYCLRFVHNLSHPTNRRTGPLDASEINEAMEYLIKTEQQSQMSDDYLQIKKGKQVRRNSRLATLQPFLDDRGLIRVGGRLRNAPISSDQKHPILLPAKSHLTELIVEHEHVKGQHAGPQLLLSSLRLQYWPLSSRNVTRKIVHNCVKCFKADPRLNQPQMGDLPAERLQPSRAFANTGVDLCGPIQIRCFRRRNSQLYKAYIVLFVCLATKAIHLELVTDLTTDAFLSGFKRFISRRGICSNVYSDNGTNFVGANRELKELRTLFQSEESQRKIIYETSSQNINWHFIPPRSPHFGGLWEAGVKSMKYHLKRVVGNASLTYEELYTTLTLIEACLNSRPITPLSNDPHDLLPLTPGHFLTGSALTALPEPTLCHIPSNRLTNWQLTQQITQHFWSRWYKEYLSFMQQRPKWSAEAANIQPGQLVVVKEDGLPPLKWVTARVIDVHPGADGRVRVVTIKTSSGGTYKRAANRLCVLPIDQDKRSNCN